MRMLIHRRSPIFSADPPFMNPSQTGGNVRYLKKSLRSDRLLE